MGKNSQKRVRIEEHTQGDKRTRYKEEPNSWLSKRPSWRLAKMDVESEKWSPTDSDSRLRDSILESLRSYEGMTWNEIQQASGGKKSGHGSNSHFENISDFIKEAQRRAEEIHIYEDQMFSLRIGGKRRLYGLIDDGIFSVIWYDKNHEIYPSG